MESVSRESNNKIVKCEVYNVIGKSEETETLDIHCKLHTEQNLPEKILIFSEITNHKHSISTDILSFYRIPIYHKLTAF